VRLALPWGSQALRVQSGAGLQVSASDASTGARGSLPDPR
jgi:hypothetical protein